jgi:hypothetical protein
MFVKILAVLVVRAAPAYHAFAQHGIEPLDVLPAADDCVLQ